MLQVYSWSLSSCKIYCKQISRREEKNPLAKKCHVLSRGGDCLSCYPEKYRKYASQSKPEDLHTRSKNFFSLIETKNEDVWSMYVLYLEVCVVIELFST